VWDETERAGKEAEDLGLSPSEVEEWKEEQRRAFTEAVQEWSEEA